MPELHTVKQGDTGIKLRATLKDENGAMDLTGWTVVMSMHLPGAGSNKVDEGACVNDPDQVANKGVTEYTWTAPDVDSPGKYEVEFKATSGANIIRFPRDTAEPYGIVRVLANKA